MTSLVLNNRAQVILGYSVQTFREIHIKIAFCQTQILWITLICLKYWDNQKPLIFHWTNRKRN